MTLKLVKIYPQVLAGFILELCHNISPTWMKSSVEHKIGSLMSHFVIVSTSEALIGSWLLIVKIEFLASAPSCCISKMPVVLSQTPPPDKFDEEHNLSATSVLVLTPTSMDLCDTSAHPYDTLAVPHSFEQFLRPQCMQAKSVRECKPD